MVLGFRRCAAETEAVARTQEQKRNDSSLTWGCDFTPSRDNSQIARLFC
jgi:hypothetical protein